MYIREIRYRIHSAKMMPSNQAKTLVITNNIAIEIVDIFRAYYSVDVKSGKL